MVKSEYEIQFCVADFLSGRSGHPARKVLRWVANPERVKEGGHQAMDAPLSVFAPDSALRLLLSRALSSGRASSL